MIMLRILECCKKNYIDMQSLTNSNQVILGKVNRPTMFFYLAVATSRGEGLVHQKLKYFHET